jgi:hypothetical protein
VVRATGRKCDLHCYVGPLRHRMVVRKKASKVYVAASASGPLQQLRRKGRTVSKCR